MRLLFRLGERGQKHGGEDGDDGNYHEQFDQGERSPAIVAGEMKLGGTFMGRRHTVLALHALGTRVLSR